MSLPYSATRLEGRELNLKRDALPRVKEHPVREIDRIMEDIVYNAIHVIQDRCEDSEFRIFYFNMMSRKDYDNQDFEDLVMFIADAIDISVSEGRHRNEEDAVIPACEDVITLHVGYLVDEYRDLEEYMARDQEASIDRAIKKYEMYMAAVKEWKRNGRRSSGRGRDDRGRGRGRDRDDDYDDRDRGRGRERGRSRDRDQWERGAVRGGVRGEPRRTVNTRENRYGGTDQSDRFADTHADDKRDDRDHRDDRDDRRDREDRNSRKDADRFDEPAPLRRATADDSPPPARVQRLPSSQGASIDEALDRETNKTEEQKMPGTKNPIVQAFTNLDAWTPSTAHPHPLAFNLKQDLYYEMDLDTKVVIPRCLKKDKIVDYYAHKSMAFGDTPRDFQRFDDGDVEKRVGSLHNALLNPHEELNVEGSDVPVKYHSRVDFTDFTYASYGLKEVLHRMNYRRLLEESKQPINGTFHPIEIAVGQAVIIEPFLVSLEEKSLLEELRQVTSFTKLCEKMRPLAKRLRSDLYVQLDRYLVRAVNRMMRQHLSIPETRITSFTGDWLDLFALITTTFGESFRDGITANQERELRNLFGENADADAMVATQVGDDNPEVHQFVLAMPTKVVYIDEVSYNLNLDMVPDVASQLMPEDHPFFHDLAQDILTKNANNFGRFYIQTADMRVVEASRSYLNEKAVLLRVIQ